MTGVKNVDREKEVKKLAELFLLWDTNPDTLLDGDYPDINDEAEKTREINEKFSLDISLSEVAELMKFRIFQNETKEKLRNQIRARENATTRPLSKVPYRDWLAGMIYSSSRGKLGIPNAVKLADKLIKELYPVEGEIDENSGN